MANESDNKGQGASPAGETGNSVAAARPPRERGARKRSPEIDEPAPANRPTVVNLAQRANPAREAPEDREPAAKRATAEPANESERRARLLREAEERDGERTTMEAQARRALEERYVLNGQEYRFRSEPARIAFKDEGKRLTTQFNTAEVARGMVDAAQAKGWKALQVNGTEEFKRQVWIESELRGVTVRGYRATQLDQKMLEDARAVRAAQNAVMERWAQGRSDAGPGRERTDGGGPAPRERPPKAEQVVAMGAAPYKFDKEENESYYLRLRDAEGREREIWGKDLERAANAASIHVGDAIRARVQEREPVTVRGNVRDEHNQVVGREQKHALRNQWEIEKVDVGREAPRAALDKVLERQGVPEGVRAQVRDVADARLSKHEAEGSAPAVCVYDRAAPREVERPARTPLEPSRSRERDSPTRG